MNRHFAAARYLTWLHTVKCHSKRASHRDILDYHRGMPRGIHPTKKSLEARALSAEQCVPSAVAYSPNQTDLILIKIARHLSVRSPRLEGYSTLIRLNFSLVSEPFRPSLFASGSGARAIRQKWRRIGTGKQPENSWKVRENSRSVGPQILMDLGAAKTSLTECDRTCGVSNRNQNLNRLGNKTLLRQQTVKKTF